MRRIREYVKITLLDFWHCSVPPIIIVAGICLPILILLGLKNGYVKSLGDKIRKSPTACEIVVHGGSHGWATQKDIHELTGLPHVQAMNLGFTRSVSVRFREKWAQSVNLSPTMKGNPRLKTIKATAVMPEFKAWSSERQGNWQSWSCRRAVERMRTLYGFSSEERSEIDSIDILDDSDENVKYIVLSSSVLERLGANVGDVVQLEIERKGDERLGDVVKVVEDFTIAASYESEDDNGYVVRRLLRWIDIFQYGDEVREKSDYYDFQWPARVTQPIENKYTGFVTYAKFCENRESNPLNWLGDSYEIGELTKEDDQTLLGLLSPERLKEKGVGVYFVRLEDSKSPMEGEAWFTEYLKANPTGTLRDRNRKDLRRDQQNAKLELLEYIPWNAPLTAELEGEVVQVCGASCNNKWFADCYENPASVFLKKDLKGDYLRVYVPEAEGLPETMTLDWNGLRIPLKVARLEQEKATEDDSRRGDADETPGRDVEAPGATNNWLLKTFPSVEEPPEPASLGAASLGEAEPPESANAEGQVVEKEPLGHEKESAPRPIKRIYVPAELLAQMYAVQEGRAYYSEFSGKFLPKPGERGISGILIYANDIENVPELREELKARRYLASVNDSQILEMKSASNSLGILTRIVAGSVFVFGIFTVVSIMTDSTSRKRGMIGILRVMGMSRFGAFFFVLLRAFMVSTLAVVVTMLFGSIFAIVMDYWRVALIFRGRDVLFVVVGVFVCGMAGSLPPAYIASRMDPIEAIQRGKNQ